MQILHIPESMERLQGENLFAESTFVQRTKARWKSGSKLTAFEQALLDIRSAARDRLPKSIKLIDGGAELNGSGMLILT